MGDFPHATHSLRHLLIIALPHMITLDCPWDASEMCEYAAEGGHLQVLMWAREQGWPWNSRVCHRAAGAGHLQVLRWAREHDCPWNEVKALFNRRSGRAPASVAVGAGARLPVECDDVRRRR